MANMEHVQLVKRGRDHVARWREANPDDNLDLNAAYMSYVRAPQVDISAAAPTSGTLTSWERSCSARISPAVT